VAAHLARLVTCVCLCSASNRIHCSEATVHSNIQLGGIATVLSVSRQLSEKYSSSLSWSVGAFPGLTMGLQRVSESTEAAADLQVCLLVLLISMSLTCMAGGG
jgi:hypothetical protein